MRLIAALLLVIVHGLVPRAMDARQEGAISPRNANYTISARLDSAARTITGVGRIVWRNRTANPTSDLRLHLYWNAWRDADSTWARGKRLAGTPAFETAPQSDRSAIDLTALRLVTAGPPTNLLNRVTFIAPDDGNTRDRTLVSARLDTPVSPGETITIEVGWTARVPKPFDRTGALDSYFFIAQWFPKIGVLEDDGWRAAQFHAFTEFFADFGRYDVSLTVPSGWIVGATGQETGRETHDNGTTTHRYVATDVHDFAWTTAPDFIEQRARFEEAGLAPVELRLILRPEHASQADRHITAAREALKHLGQRLGPLPWPNLTIVDPVTIVNTRTQGATTGGMEYPTFIAADTRWTNRWSDANLEDVIVHEIAHQYFQSAVATDEVREAWIDEGLATWLTGDVLETAFPHRFSVVGRYFGGLVSWRHLDVRWSRLHQGYYLDDYRLVPGWDAPTTPTLRQSPRTWDYTIYARTPLVLETLRGLIGGDAMTRVLATFAARGRFAHPTGADFMAAVESASTPEARVLFERTLNSADTFDYAVEDVVVHMPEGRPVESTVVLRRVAAGTFPVDIAVTFGDGSQLTEQWDGAAPWHTLQFERRSGVVRVEIDPDRVLALDVNRTNNSWTSAPQASRAADRWTRRWVMWMQQFLLTYAFFV